MINCGIYKITNTINNKCYIGKAQNITKRKNWHLSYLRRNQHTNKHLQAAFNQYGEVAFIFTSLLYCNKESLDKYEVLFIKIYNSSNPSKGYNKSLGGDGSNGLKHTEEEKLKISKALTGKVRSDEHRKHISESHKGMKYSDEVKAKRAAANFKHSEESKVKMSAAQSGENNAMYGKHHTEETRAKIALGRIGKPMSKAIKDKISSTTKGKVFSEETRAKLSEAQRLIWLKRKKLSM